uniref:Uncharacterized protein n=1 Tax=Oryza nivara TaxID=4536 RepID=A0A0E0I7A0_ORYNI
MATTDKRALLATENGHSGGGPVAVSFNTNAIVLLALLVCGLGAVALHVILQCALCVNVDSTAETLGIRRGDVIVFQDTDSCTSPQLENYLLSLGWGYLQGIRLTADLKVEVHNLMDSYRESITFPLQFSDASRRRIEVT